MITWEIVLPPQNGTAVISSDSEGKPIARYISNGGYAGDDSFTYMQRENGVELVTRKVCITVEVPNYPKVWRAAGPTCEVINGMITGKLTYTMLEEIDTYTGDPTGLTRPNTPGQPDYVAPVMDPIACPAATGWRGIEVGSYCQISGGTNTGRKVYEGLEQFYLVNNELTGLTKPNTPGDPNYIPPVQDLDKCPVGITYTASRSAYFLSAICLSPTSVPVPITFSKTYTSTISQSDAFAKAYADPNFNSEGQAYANQYGSCQADPDPEDPDVLMMYDTYFRSDACMTDGQENRLIAGTEEAFAALSTVTEVASVTDIYFFKDITGIVKVDRGWYMGLDNDKSFYMDGSGMVTHFRRCAVVLPTLQLAIEEDVEGNTQIWAIISSPYTQNIRVGGRIDINPLEATPFGTPFDITIVQGETMASDPNFNFVREIGTTYHWQSAYAEPNTFVINKQTPI